MTVVDDFLKKVPQPQRDTLKVVRDYIKAAAPDAVDAISYGMPAFKVDGKVVGGFLPTKKGCSYYPFSGSVLAVLSKDLEKYSQTMSALHFAADKPLPKTLVAKLVKTRLKEIAIKGR